MAVKETVTELVSQLLVIENEMTTLREDKKELLASYKDKLDVKALQAAIRVAKIKSKLSNMSETEFDNMLDAVEDKICVEFIP